MLAVDYRNQCNAFGEAPDPLLLELLDRQENQAHGTILRDAAFLVNKLFHYFCICSWR